MKSLLILILSNLFIFAHAQTSTEKTTNKKGFIFGTAFGASFINLNFEPRQTQNEISASLPNFKIGTMISKRSALFVYLPGSIYTFNDSGRKRDRGFEGIIPSFQYWIKERWYILGGVGLGMDAPAFYDIKNEEERKFYFGTTVIAGTGYEFWQKGKFAMDIQSRMHYGSVDVAEGKLNGLAFSVLIGFNWY